MQVRVYQSAWRTGTSGAYFQHVRDHEQNELQMVMDTVSECFSRSLGARMTMIGDIHAECA